MTLLDTEVGISKSELGRIVCSARSQKCTLEKEAKLKEMKNKIKVRKSLNINILLLKKRGANIIRFFNACLYLIKCKNINSLSINYLNDSSI